MENDIKSGIVALVRRKGKITQKDLIDEFGEAAKGEVWIGWDHARAMMIDYLSEEIRSALFELIEAPKDIREIWPLPADECSIMAIGGGFISSEGLDVIDIIEAERRYKMNQDDSITGYVPTIFVSTEVYRQQLQHGKEAVLTEYHRKINYPKPSSN